MDTESIQETLKIFDFTTAYAMLMRLITDMYLNKFFPLAKSWGLSHKMYESVNKKSLSDPKNQVLGPI